MNISWQLLHTLEQTYGDSYYLLHLDAFEANYKEFLEAFRADYPNSNIAYSYKTNYIPKLCQLVNTMGGYAEVVSSMEYDLAVHIGVPSQRIIFNGPYKSEFDLERALLAGSIVNLDSFYEVAMVEAIARRAPGQILTVGLRCNVDLGIENVSRFGFDTSGQMLESAFRTLRRVKNCRVAGLHCHLLTPTRSAESYAFLVKKMLEIAAGLFEDAPPQFIDVGGGFFSKMIPALRKQFPFAIPTFQEYAQAISPLFANTFPGGLGPELLLEPGIAITADTMQFVAKVIDIKTVRSRVIALLSGSIYNIKPTKNTRNLPIRVFHNNDDIKSRYADGIIDLVGYTCMEDDCLYTGYQGHLSVGDYVVFDNVGAYTIVLKPPFISPCPPIISYDANLKDVTVIRHQEKFSHIFSTYVF
ncbi:Orn/DAP/Arg decarboxylase 2 [Candidatus Vecturithrix granuli]|uniref:Orn/DAP/Arg decarboxylase 2 n=1 Tax=Vecturithrix granuli TaxID=1499967 RepID=A0A081BX31_VECG1|nr:Orn/DAP/Arg decarboxylase 2 [Candidatus Vecturithrix granuli]